MAKTILTLLSVSVISLLGFASSAAAQSDPKVGVAMGYPSVVQVIWHATDRVAFRPELSFARTANSTTDDDFEFESESSSVAVGPGISALFYLTRWDNVRSYLAARYAYSHLSSKATLDGSTLREDSSATHSTSGSLGVQFTPHRRFGVFGEIGLSFSHSSDEGRSGSTLGVRTGIGAILYF